jgi:hypothetical protein
VLASVRVRVCYLYKHIRIELYLTLCYFSKHYFIFHFLLEILMLFPSFFLVIMANSLEMWSFELMVLLSGLLPNPKLETSVLSIWLVSYSRSSSILFWHYYIWLWISLTFCWWLGYVSLNTSAAVWMIPFGLSGAIRLVFLNSYAILNSVAAYMFYLSRISRNICV